MKRANGLLTLDGMQQTGRSVLGAGCADGMLGVALESYGHHAVLLDYQDWRNPRARNLTSLTADMCSGLPLRNGRFDSVCSYNVFEHVRLPTIAFQELLWCCAAGGLLHLDFGPLFASPWGLHAYRTLRMPYPQSPFSPCFLEKTLKLPGIHDLGEDRDSLQPMNCWRPAQFRQLWSQPSCSTVCFTMLTDNSHLDLVLEFPEVFRGRDFSIEDLTTEAIVVTLKRAPPVTALVQ